MRKGHGHPPVLKLITLLESGVMGKSPRLPMYNFPLFTATEVGTM